MKTGESGLTAWGLTMMALGTVVGGSFFLGSGIAIKAAGPGIIVSFILGGALVYFILFALSEMTVADTAQGSFRTFAERQFSRGVGFVTGWLYWTGLILAMSSEAIAVSLFLKVWIPGISLPVLGSLIIILITLANLLGAEWLSKLESSLAAVKIFAIIGFIVVGIVLITGLLPDRPPLGLGVLTGEAFFPSGIGGITGSMLIVMFSYAGFEIIGLAAPEARNPRKNVPKAIAYSVISLVGLYVLATAVILPLIRTNELREDVSPFVSALAARGMEWAASTINIVLVTAILSTMLAATFGLGRMLRSLAQDGHAPSFIRDKGEVPYRGILFSGFAMLLGLSLGFILPRQVYIFLVSSGGFSLLFTYFIILATHYRFRRSRGCPPKGECQLIGFPYTSLAAQIAILIILASMPMIPGQGPGLLAGIALVLFFTAAYLVKKYWRKRLVYT
ncbi:MAG: amino acid permease [Clostridia bacterium]|nr:amino acid permease [Clostridia bacterium]